MQLLNIGLRGRYKIEHNIKALRAADARDMARYQAWKDKAEQAKEQAIQSKKDRAEYNTERAVWETQLHTSHEMPLENWDEEYKEKKEMGYYTDRAKQVAINKEFRKRQDLMFASTYHTDPSHKSFLDLPPEVRNTIYTLSMFHHAECEPSFKLIFNRERDALVPWLRTFQPSFSGNLAISIVEMLGAMNKEIRLEARSAFYRSAVISLQGEPWSSASWTAPEKKAGHLYPV
jgi:hypothetical protein